MGFPSVSGGKESACTVTTVCVPGLGRFLRKHIQTISVFLPENLMERGNLWATVRRVTKSWTIEATESTVFDINGFARLSAQRFFKNS